MIRRFDMRRSDNFPVSGTVTAIVVGERMFIPTGFKPKSAIVSAVSGGQVKVDGYGDGGFFVKFSKVENGTKIEFQYMVS